MERFTGCAPAHICALFRDGCCGYVEMVNSRGIYLQLAGKHILLCHSRFGTVPNGASVAQWERLPSLLTQGEPIRLEKGILYLSSGALEMQLLSIPKDTRVRLPEATSFRLGLETLLAQAKPTGLSSLVYPLFTGQRCSLNPYCETAIPHVRELLQALQTENTDMIYLSVCALLGLGPGLTPSGDDLLSGLLYGLRHSPARDSLVCTYLTEAIRSLAGERTNAVSADYLLALTEDAPFDRMAAAWADPAAGAAGLLQIGNHSGGEMLLGLLCAGSLQSLFHP